MTDYTTVVTPLPFIDDVPPPAPEQLAAQEQRTREQLNSLQTLLADIEVLSSFPSPEATVVIRDRIQKIRSLIGYP